MTRRGADQWERYVAELEKRIPTLREIFGSLATVTWVPARSPALYVVPQDERCADVQVWIDADDYKLRLGSEGEVVLQADSAAMAAGRLVELAQDLMAFPVHERTQSDPFGLLVFSEVGLSKPSGFTRLGRSGFRWPFLPVRLNIHPPYRGQ